MELRILRCFLTVAREENITRAAEILPMPGKERWGALVPAKCPLAQKQYITREDLAGRRVFMTYRGVTQGVSDWFGDYYDKMDVFAVYTGGLRHGRGDNYRRRRGVVQKSEYCLSALLSRAGLFELCVGGRFWVKTHLHKLLHLLVVEGFGVIVI